MDIVGSSSTPSMSSKVGASCGIYFMLTCLQPQSLAMDRCIFNSSGWHNRCHLCRRHGARTRWLRTSRSFPILIILMHNAQSCSAPYSAPQTVGVLFAFLNAAVLAPFAEVGAFFDFVCNASSVVIHFLFRFNPTRSTLQVANTLVMRRRRTLCCFREWEPAPSSRVTSSSHQAQSTITR